jgi:PhzF family phenazine biosynthesis protein
MASPLYQVDAFAERPFTGNPAAVCLLEKPADAVWMQDVAREMNLSETAFVSPRDGGFDLRWFTPAVEVALCGHATLASAHVLWETERLSASARVRFHTQSGWITCARKGEWIEMDFPAKPETPVPTPPGLLQALGVPAVYVGKNAFDYLVVVDREELVRGLKPDIAALGTLPVRGVIVTSRSSGSDCDFVSRFFAPAAGVAEDPVTGSAHCALAPFWAKRLGKDTLVGHQLSARGGTVRTRVQGERVFLGGKAVTVLRGELM